VNQNEVSVLYEYAAALMPNEGKWNKPSSPGQIVAHAHALRNVPFGVACFAADIVMTREGKWPAPWQIIKVAKTLDADLDSERMQHSYGPQIDEAVAIVTHVTELAIAAQHQLEGKAPRQAQLESGTST